MRATPVQARTFHATLMRLERFARDDSATILIQGESGTGKTSLARFVHNSSPRASGPFLHVVLSALDDSVAGSELFGHTAGAFTDARGMRAGLFASANGGTLFLDEIGKCSPAIQARLLHAIEYGVIRPVGADRDVWLSVRIVVATNADLPALVRDGRFLPDLLARLAAFRVTVPPLRDRRADIPALIAEMLLRHAPAAGYGECPPTVQPDLMRAIQRAAWPDNVRELDGAIHRLMLEAEGAPHLTLGHCRHELAYLAGMVATRSLTVDVVDEAVQLTGSLSGASRLLGVDRKTLRSVRQRTLSQAGDPHPAARATGGTPQRVEGEGRGQVRAP